MTGFWNFGLCMCWETQAILPAKIGNQNKMSASEEHIYEDNNVKIRKGSSWKTFNDWNNIRYQMYPECRRLRLKLCWKQHNWAQALEKATLSASTSNVQIKKYINHYLQISIRLLKLHWLFWISSIPTSCIFHLG